VTIHTTILLLLVSATTSTLAQGPEMDHEELKALRTYCKADIERVAVGLRFA
jgi:hypothetical protein